MAPRVPVVSGHFFLDSQRTLYTTTHCYERYTLDESDAAKRAREKCEQEDQRVKRGEQGRGDIAFLLLEMVIAGVSLFTGYDYTQTVGLPRGGGNLSARTTQLRNNVTTSANRVSPPTQASE
jgi:hypothetical protein